MGTLLVIAGSAVGVYFLIRECQREIGKTKEFYNTIII